MSRLRFVEETGSTNADLLGDIHAVEGDWLVADRQLAGKGRQGRQWQSPTGNFYGSTLILLRGADPEPPTLALVAGLALVDALETAAPGVPVTLKWPNDVLRNRGKLAGILLERANDRVVAGFGVNLAVAPSIEGRETASLSDVANLGVHGFAPLLAASFARLLGAWRMAEPSALATAWEARAHPRGTPLSVHVGQGEMVTGTFDGVDTDGAMRLIGDDGTLQVIRVGDVSLA
jgi:BirA family biotin operon repressor/biotin-[acetyl-CoA-carboxylase] ligase